MAVNIGAAYHASGACLTSDVDGRGTSFRAYGMGSEV